MSAMNPVKFPLLPTSAKDLADDLVLTFITKYTKLKVGGRTHRALAEWLSRRLKEYENVVRLDERQHLG
jgi:hypothetical protein